MSTATYEFAGRQRRRVIAAASAGNFVEWYDWGVYVSWPPSSPRSSFPPATQLSGC